MDFWWILGGKTGGFWGESGGKAAILRLYRGAQSAGSEATKAGGTSSEKLAVPVVRGERRVRGAKQQKQA